MIWWGCQFDALRYLAERFYLEGFRFEPFAAITDVAGKTATACVFKPLGIALQNQGLGFEQQKSR
jgi:hypothetical protein